MLLLTVIWFNVFTTLYAQNNKTGDDLTSRVWYGERANIKDFPSFAALANCGAAILSEWWLATAAHCVHDHIFHQKGKRVWVGIDSKVPTSHSSQPYTFDEVIIYPDYWELHGIPVNDIALLKLTRPLKFSDKVKPIQLPNRNYELNEVYAVAGMGIDETRGSSKHLMSMNVRTLGANDCLSYLPWSWRLMLRPHLDEIKQVTICTKRDEDKPGICHGDSGSPLVRGNCLVGIVSYINNRDCSKARLGMFTDVAPFVGWIKEVTGIQ